MPDSSFQSLPDMLRINALKFRDQPALKYRKQGKFVTMSYGQLYERTLMVTRGLKKLNVKPGDRIAILSENRVGWVIADLGILCAGAVTVPVYPTDTPGQIEYLLNHSGAKIIFVSGKFQYDKLLKVRAALPGLESAVSFERITAEPSLHVCSFYQLSEIDTPVTAAEKRELEAGIDRIAPGDMLTLIYTSGTTGVPKGVMLSHRNILANILHVSEQSGAVSAEDVFLGFLPLSHVLERTAGCYMVLGNGALMAFADSSEKIAENMLEVQPTIMVTVPRLLEKIYHRIFEKVHQQSIARRMLFHWAVEVGRKYVAEKYLHQQPCAFVRAEYALADRLVFSRLRKKFGGRMKLFCCGGAPLDRTINEFFWVIGIPVFEGYGLTETSPVVSFNNLANVRFGSVGVLLAETGVKIAADGEILVNGPQVMLGYYHDPAATAEALRDGWLKTGDVGRLEDGFLYITDRKKELIITAGGKNIAPQPLENELKMDKYLSSAFVYGDQKPYLIALLVPNLERLLEFAKENRLDYLGLDDLVKREPVQKLYEQRIAAINGRLPQYETIKKFALLPHDFSIENGELTPTLKFKRKVIYEKHRQKIEDMYSDHSN